MAKKRKRVWGSAAELQEDGEGKDRHRGEMATEATNYEMLPLTSGSSGSKTLLPYSVVRNLVPLHLSSFRPLLNPK